MLIEQVPLDQLLEIAAEGDAESVGDRVSAVSSARRELGLHRHRGYSAPRPPSPCGSSSSCHGSILAVQSMAYKRVIPFGVSSQPTGGRPWLPERLADPALTERVTPILAAAPNATAGPANGCPTPTADSRAVRRAGCPGSRHS
jgi:hypothetical protein